MRAVVVRGLIAGAVLVTSAYEGRCGAETSTVAIATGEDANFDVKGLSKAMGEAALRLKREAADRDRKLQQLEADLGGNVGEIVLILQSAADELAPEAEFRTLLAGAADDIRSSANQAVVDLDRENRQKAPHLRDKLGQLETVSRDAEELRTTLVPRARQFTGFAGPISCPRPTLC